MFYYLILLVLCFLSFSELYTGTLIKIQKNILYLDMLFFIMLALCLFYITAFRYEIGRDYEAYLTYFDNCLVIKNTYFEKGYVVINKFFKTYVNNFYVMQLFVTLIIWYWICKNMLRNSIFPCFTLFLYYISNFFPTNMMQFRQFIAIGIVCYGMKFVIARQFLYWCVFVLLASSFHSTAFLAFPLYFTSRLRLKSFFYFISLIITIFITFFGRNFLFTIIEIIIEILPYERYVERLSAYLNHTQYITKTEFSSGLGFCVRNFFYLYMVFLHNENDEYYFTNFFISLLINSFAINFETLTRVAFYYDICGNGYCAYNIFGKKSQKIHHCSMFVPGMFLIFTILTFIKQLNSPDKFGLILFNDIYPYRNFLIYEEWKLLAGSCVLLIVSLCITLILIKNFSKKYFLKSDLNK